MVQDLCVRIELVLSDHLKTVKYSRKSWEAKLARKLRQDAFCLIFLSLNKILEEGRTVGFLKVSLKHDESSDERIFFLVPVMPPKNSSRKRGAPADEPKAASPKKAMAKKKSASGEDSATGVVIEACKSWGAFKTRSGKASFL